MMKAVSSSLLSLHTSEQADVAVPPVTMQHALRRAQAVPSNAMLSPADWRALMPACQEILLPVGTIVFRPGDRCERYFVVTAGTVRVVKTAENGREIVLYRVNGGETCSITTSCLMAQECYPASGIAETQVHALTLDAAAFEQALGNSPTFRRFVFAAFSQRLGNLIARIEEIALQRIDVRLARYLLAAAETAGIVLATHQQLAVELGSAREVVSRMLKEFEHQGALRLGHKQIEICDRALLHTILLHHL